jgi:mono/diheme cytochrome c family protein
MPSIRSLTALAGSGGSALAAIVAGLLVWLGPGLASGQQAADIANPFEGDPAAIEKGAERFAERCTFCHGTRGRGAKGPSLVSGKWKYGGRNADLFISISAGRPNTQMGAFASSLTGEEIWQIIAFLRDEHKKRQAQSDPDAPK